MRIGLLGWIVLGLACGDDDPPQDAGRDAGPADAGAEDARREDAGRDAGADASAAQPSDAPYKRPWVMQVETDRALIRWETRELAPESAAVSVTPETGGAERIFERTDTRTDALTFGYELPLLSAPDLPGTYHLHDVVVDGLEPATCYRYHIVDHESFGGRFCTMHAATDHERPIDVLVLGDTSVVLRSPDVLASTLTTPVDFVVHLGDVQYYEAILESWQLFFRDMGPMLEAGGFFPCIGNHESELDGEYEATYARYFDAPSRDGDIHRYHFETGGVHFFAVNSEDDIGEFDAEFAWLADALDAAEATEGFRASIVYFHRPIYTLSRHAPSLSLRGALEPIITSHRVPLVLQGHNHVYERFQVGDVVYIVSGGGGSARYDANESVEAFPAEVPLRQVSGAWHHGVRLHIDATEIAATVIDVDGEARDEFRIALPSM